MYHQYLLRALLFLSMMGYVYCTYTNESEEPDDTLLLQVPPVPPRDRDVLGAFRCAVKIIKKYKGAKELVKDSIKEKKSDIFWRIAELKQNMAKDINNFRSRVGEIKKRISNRNSKALEAFCQRLGKYRRNVDRLIVIYVTHVPQPITTTTTEKPSEEVPY